MIIKIFTGPLNYDVNRLYQKDKDEFIVGVDQGCLLLKENDIYMDLAVGDFDSIPSKMIETISDFADKIVVYPSMKDETDTKIALREVKDMKAEKIIIYGGLGQRFDHSYANLMLLDEDIMIINDTTTMYLLYPGEYKIDNRRKYISFFAKEDVRDLSLDGFKYELSNIELDMNDPLCISNQGSGTIRFKSGVILVIEQDE
jgi:thiamine pyrophosphokinase